MSNKENPDNVHYGDFTKLVKPDAKTAKPSLLVSCVDYRLNEAISKIFPDYYIIRYAGGAVPAASTLTDIPLNNTFEVLKSAGGPKNVVVMMHSDCGAIKVARNGGQIAAPIISGSLHAHGKDAQEGDVIITSLHISSRNLASYGKQYGFDEDGVVALCCDLSTNKISVLKGCNLVEVKPGVDVGNMPEDMKKSIICYNLGINLPTQNVRSV